MEISRTPSPKTSLPVSAPADGAKSQPADDQEPTERNGHPLPMDKRRSISFAGPSMGSGPPPLGPRRLSIQFAPSAPKPTSIQIPETLPESIRKRGIRVPSPPPPTTYMTRTSFDTFNNPAVTDPSFTLISKHAGYTYSRHQRVFLVAVDHNDYSDFALRWLIEHMVEDGDEIICLRVLERDEKASKESATSLQRNYKKDAKRLLEHIQATNNRADNKAVSIILEFATGNVEETIQRMIAIYSPSFLTVGTRGRSLGGIQGLLPGSVSKWCMQNSPVPVVMVRHPEKRHKKMQKRMRDPNRKGYSTILDQSGSIDNKASMSDHVVLEASETEAEAVAKAIGLSSRLGNWKGFRKEGSEAGSTKSEGEEGDESEPDTPSPTGAVFVEGPGLEDMPNYASDPEEDPEGMEAPELDDDKDHNVSASQFTEQVKAP